MNGECVMDAKEEGDLEEVVQLVRDCGLAIGHADTHVELMRQVLSQFEEARKRIEKLEAAAVKGG